MSNSKPVVENVRSFWNTEACGTHFVETFNDTRDFYEKFREHRYRTEWHLLNLVPFSEAKGKKLLEIGIGNGADGAMFALNGAIYTGADLTLAALEATRRHFEVLGLTGEFKQENAEQLSFADESFDWVYSHGVLHHTPNTAVALSEVWRVLKPGGRAIVMLYHKHSFNYWVRIMTFMRARMLVHIFTRIGCWKRDRQSVNTSSLMGLRGNQDRRIWDLHYQGFLREGWSYLRARNFVHHCTDGPECPVAYAFSKSEAHRMFSRFSTVETKVAHFPLRKYSRWIPFIVEKILAPRLGWYLFIYARK